MANKYNVEMQLGYAELAKKDIENGKPPKDAYLDIPDDPKSDPRDGDYVERDYRRPSEKEITETRAWIKEQQAKYPGTLEDLFRRWLVAFRNVEQKNAVQKTEIKEESKDRQKTLITDVTQKMETVGANKETLVLSNDPKKEEKSAETTKSIERHEAYNRKKLEEIAPATEVKPGESKKEEKAADSTEKKEGQKPVESAEKKGFAVLKDGTKAY